MGEEAKGFGEQLYSRLQGKGLSKYQVDKVLALQRLDPEVAELASRGLLGDAQIIEISKIASAARQKQLAELTVEKSLPASWVKELAKVIRQAEKARSDAESNKYWDFFFEIKEMIEKEGPTRSILQIIRNFRVEKPASREGRLDVVEQTDRTVVSFNKMELELGRGLDVGTVNICAAARKRKTGEVVYNIQRDAFLDVRSDTFTRKMLMKLGIDFIEQGDKGYVIGDPAFELANIFEKNTRRPMKDGMISPVEPEALLIVSLLIAQLLGHPQTPGEVCAVSVPADPIDADRNVIYHRGALETVLRKLGYIPKPMLEGHSVVFAELQEQDYTGMGISCGGGMFNVCVAYKSVPALTFSTSRGGDWIDNNVAAAIGMPMSLVCAVKEGGVDLRNPKDRVQDAIVIYYRNLIHYTLETVRQKFESAQNMPTFMRPIDLVCAGGTSLIEGFIDVFREEFEKINFPIEVARIRLARDPLKAIAMGCLQAAIEEQRALVEIPVDVAPATMARSTAVTTTKADDTTRLRRLGPAASVTDRAEPQRALRMDITPPPHQPAGAPLAETSANGPETVVRVEIPSPTESEPAAEEEDLQELEEVEAVQELEALEEIGPEPQKKDAPKKDEPGDLPLIS